MPSLVLVFAEKLVDVDSDIDGPPVVVEAATTYIRAKRTQHARALHDAWFTPASLPPLQVFPTHLLRFLASLHQDYSLYREYQTIPYNRWLPMWRARFNSLDPHMLLSHELSALHLELRTSTTPEVGKGIFTQKEIGKGEVIGYFYGTLVYNNAPISSS